MSHSLWANGWSPQEGGGAFLSPDQHALVLSPLPQRAVTLIGHSEDVWGDLPQVVSAVELHVGSVVQVGDGLVRVYRRQDRANIRLEETKSQTGTTLMSSQWYTVCQTLLYQRHCITPTAFINVEYIKVVISYSLSQKWHYPRWIVASQAFRHLGYNVIHFLFVFSRSDAGSCSVLEDFENFKPLPLAGDEANSCVLFESVLYLFFPFSFNSSSYS